MTNDNISRVLGPTMAANLLWWSEMVFRPARMARKLGLHRPNSSGTLPEFGQLSGGGQNLSKSLNEPSFLSCEPTNYAEVEDFDRIAPLYESAVLPFSAPIFNDMLALLAPYLSPSCRILDPSCGAGTEARKLAQIVPDGEVIAADLSRGMVEYTWRQSKQAGITNMAFFQADVADPPEVFTDYFHVVFCELSFHHYPDAEAAIKTFYKVIRKGGILIIADPGPAWFNRLVKRFSDLADPGFVKHRTAEEFNDLCRIAGFRHFYWVQSLPGIGITLAAK